jgi:hypothetical protein
VKALTKTVTVEVHWSWWLKEELEACDVPAYISACATPEEAWSLAHAQHLYWVVERFSLGAAFDRRVMLAGLNVDDSDHIRKVFPKPPATVMRSLAKWMRKNQVPDGFYQDY